MNKAEAVYEFINQYAYFACSGIIMMENYSVSSGTVDDLINTFDVFMEGHKEWTKRVEKGEISEEAADSILKASLKKLRSSSVNKFFKLIEENIFPNTLDSKERKKLVSDMVKEVNSNKATNKELIEFIEALRQGEEKVLKEIKP